MRIARSWLMRGGSCQEGRRSRIIGYYYNGVTDVLRESFDPFAVGSKTRAFFSVRWKLVF